MIVVETAVCLACDVPCDEAVYCEKCGKGPFCRYCLVLRHAPTRHTLSWLDRLGRSLHLKPRCSCESRRRAIVR